MSGGRFRRGEPVVYTKSKASLHPGPRARAIHAWTSGDGYSYVVDKFWVVVEELDGGRLVLRTRRGKTHVVEERDPGLRRPRFWERLRFRDRFPALENLERDVS